MPETGNVLKAPVYKNDNQTTKVFLQLPPEGSVFVVLREQSGQKHIVSIVKDYETNYPVEHGDSSSISPVDLMENQANEENMILLKPDNILYLDLERVKMIADVYLNKNHLGILWKPPFRLDITESILTGINTLIVEVANDWSNRIVGTGSDNCCKKTKFHS
jgi:hypothetical protein